MNILESEIEHKACSWAATHFGARNIKLQKSKGWPDRLFLFGGKCLFVEFKRPGESPRPLQAHILDFLSKDGFDVLAIDSFEQFKAYFATWTRGMRLTYEADI